VEGSQNIKVQEVPDKDSFSPFEVYLIRRFDNLENAIRAQNTRISEIASVTEEQALRKQDACSKKDARLDSLEKDWAAFKTLVKWAGGIGALVWSVVLIVITLILDKFIL
jgi:hypothetical protein